MADPEVTRVRLSTEGIEDVISALKKVQGEVGRTGDAGKKAGDALGALGTIFAAQRLAAFAAAAIDTADGLGKMAQKTGAAVESLSVLTYMGQQADLSNQDLEKGLVKLAKSLEALQKGDATAAESFQALGLSAKDLKDLSLDQALVKIANAQARFADGSGKTATLLAILGKSGANMIPLLNDLADGGFEHARTKLQDLGLVISTEMAKNSQEFNDSMKRVEMAAQGAVVQVAQTALPALAKGMDLLTEAIAESPAAVKTFVIGTAEIGTVATASAIAVRMLFTSFAGLGPVGIAVVTIAAATAGLVAWQAAAEAAQEERVKDAAAASAQVREGERLTKAYELESKILEKGRLTATQAQEHQAKLKAIKDELLKLSPTFQDALAKEASGHKAVAEAMEEVNKGFRENQNLKRKSAQGDLTAAKAAMAALDAEAKEMRQQSTSDQARGLMSSFSPTYVAGGGQSYEARRKAVQAQIDDAQRRLDAVNGVVPAPASGPAKPPVPPGADKAGLKAAAAQALAEAKRQAEDVRQANEAISKDYEDLYKHGLLDLEEYYQSRRSLIQADTDNEVRLLQAQIQAEQAASQTAATPAERQASETRLYELQTQIQAKQAAGAAKLRDLDRQARDDREKSGQEALKLEAELADAKGQTGEAAIRAIQAEIDKRKEAARTQQERDLLDQLAAARINRTRLDAHTQALDRGRSTLDMQLASVDAQRGQGLFGDDEALRRKADLYRQLLDTLENIATEQLRIARESGNKDDLLKAEQSVVSVEQLRASLHDLTNQIDWVKTTAKDAFESGLTDLLVSLTDQTTTLTEKMQAFGRAVAQAMIQAGAAKVAAGITGSLFGFAGGGAVRGPGTTTSDSIPALLSNREYVVRAAAVDHYGESLFHALNGLRLPRALVPHYAQGGLVGASAGAGALAAANDGTAGVTVGSITITVNEATGQASVASDMPQGLVLGKLIKSAVLDVLRTESRTNGALYRRS